jgi:uncharacterized protein (TIGR02391 family)
MLTPKRDRILREAIKRYGMSEEKFHFALGGGQMQIIYKPEGFYFRLVASRPPVSTSFLYIYSTPDKSALTVDSKKEVYLIAESWDDAEVAFESWLAWIKEEYHEQTGYEQAAIEEERDIWDAINSVHDEPDEPLAHLHPAIQKTANSLYTTNHYSQAIHAACTALEKAIQAKSGQSASVTGTALIGKVFPKDNPIISLSDDQGEREGYGFLYRGLLQAIRNHYAHNLTEIPAARALEWLCFISALFYKLDEAHPTATPTTP